MDVRKEGASKVELVHFGRADAKPSQTTQRDEKLTRSSRE